MTRSLLTRLEAVCLLAAACGAVLVWHMPTAAATSATVVALLFPTRALWRAHRARLPPERVLILGTGRLATRVASALELRPERSVVVGMLDDGGRAPGRRRHLVLARASQVHRAVRRVKPDRIIVALEPGTPVPASQLLRQRMRGIRVEDGVAAYERLTGKVPIESVQPVQLLFEGFPEDSGVELASRLLSVTAAVTALAALWPLLALIALLIKLDSAGPVFFVQPRLGRRGRTFALVKFRTMHVAQGKTSEWVRDNRHRITRVGEWLRRFRLDELPQLTNILRGDMNLVGPRPHPVSNAAVFAREIPFYWLRARVRPGLTGWAQVHYGYANSLDEETEKMRYDLYYIKHRSLWLDLKILPATVRAVFAGGGASTPRAPATVVPLRGRVPIRPAAAGLGVSRRPGSARSGRQTDVHADR